MAMRQLLYSKLHGGTVTCCDLHYEGSCGLGPELLEASGLLPFEKVSVLNVSTGARLETYVIASDKQGEISLNGAAARYASVGDKLIIFAFSILSEEEMAAHQARIVILGEGNRVVSTRLESPTAPGR